MSNYDIDEIERQKKRERRSRGIKSENEMKNRVEVEIDLPEKDLLKLALLAHEKDITLNDFVNDVLIKGIIDGEYRFEHDKRPQLLNETE